MYGMQDLMLHILYVNQREKMDPMFKVSLDRVILSSLAACYYHGFDINYDYLIEKSTYGAKSAYGLVTSKLCNYGRRLDLSNGVCIKELEVNKKLDEKIVWFIKQEVENPWSLVGYIKNSEPYLKDIDEIEKAAEENSLFISFPYWTKKDIVSIFSEDSSNIDSRIPLKKEHYEIMNKYLQLEWGEKNSKIFFTQKELLVFHGIPSHLIKTVEENGCYHDKKLD